MLCNASAARDRGRSGSQPRKVCDGRNKVDVMFGWRWGRRGVLVLTATKCAKIKYHAGTGSNARHLPTCLLPPREWKERVDANGRSERHGTRRVRYRGCGFRYSQHAVYFLTRYTPQSLLNPMERLAESFIIHNTLHHSIIASLLQRQYCSKQRSHQQHLPHTRGVFCSTSDATSRPDNTHFHCRYCVTAPEQSRRRTTGGRRADGDEVKSGERCAPPQAHLHLHRKAAGLLTKETASNLKRS